MWISSWLLIGGWPFLIIPIILSFLYRRRNGKVETKLFTLKSSLILPCVVLGFVIGLVSYGFAHLPISTSSMIFATQLAFTARLAFLLVKQKFFAFTINAIFLLCTASVVRALYSSTDCPDHESNMKYYEGFFMTLGASALNGFILPSIELTMKKAKQLITYPLVMEMQILMSFIATVFCTIRMLINHDFKAIPQEARNFELGEVTYYVIVVVNALFWQMVFLGVIGVIFCASSLLFVIISVMMLPVCGFKLKKDLLLYHKDR